MSHLLVYHIVSGHAWFSSIILFLIIVAIDLCSFFDERKRARLVARILLILSFIVAAISGTPLSLLFAGPLIAAAITYVFAGFGCAIRKRRGFLAVIISVLLIAALLLEIPSHIARFPEEPRPQKLYVFGDSITAGGFGEKQRYPSLLQESASIEVKDLSHAGATAESALMFQAARLELQKGREWAVLEIGGNDMLHGTPAHVYHENLEQLINKARGDLMMPRKLVMFELPIVPGCWAFGRYQRQLAEKYSVTLIPKRILAGILLDQRNTVDGIHLTQRGHDRMAEELLKYIGTAVSQPSRTLPPD
jgi:acyl-CoA thioesterase I